MSEQGRREKPTLSSSRETTSLDEGQFASELPKEISFFSGNPSVEVTNGIIHLYKKKHRSQQQQQSHQQQQNQQQPYTNTSKGVKGPINAAGRAATLKPSVAAVGRITASQTVFIFVPFVLNLY